MVICADGLPFDSFTGPTDYFYLSPSWLASAPMNLECFDELKEFGDFTADFEVGVLAVICTHTHRIGEVVLTPRP